jgi:L-histidine N-alpha-methyltransferase
MLKLYEDHVTTASIASNSAVLSAALAGLTSKPQKTLPPWLFYDELGSRLFEQITALPEYYLTRTERALFAAHAEEILSAASTDQRLTLIELGAGSASKTGILLAAAARRQGNVLYQPIDISATALDEASAAIATNIPGVIVAPLVANYITEPFTVSRLPGEHVLALYIGSSVGNFSPAEASDILRNLRDHLQAGDTLLLGTDLAPSDQKSVAMLLAAYDDAAGVTAAFNKNILTRLNRELDANFSVNCFTHRARWNANESRIEMHLESRVDQAVLIGDTKIVFRAGETIHTENSYKFTQASLAALFASAGFEASCTFLDAAESFAVTLATAV